ncbi:MAG: class I SAM-dependent methyltransferase [Pseudomonadota bacterium]
MTSTLTNKDARFWDRIAPKYEAKPVPDEAVYREKLKLTQALLNPNMEILEFGCGTGSTAIEHAPHVRHILATDFSRGMLEIAEGKAQAAGVSNVTFRQSSIERFEDAAERYDVVLALSILHLVADREAALAKIHSLLNPGGIFVSSTACIGEDMAWLGWIAPLGKALGLLPNIEVFGREAFGADVTKAGFEILKSWSPGRGRGIFIIARKPGPSA